jgi:hypothetical protein
MGRDGLARLRDLVKQTTAALNIAQRKGIDAWLSVVEGKLLPRLRPDFPLTAAICGGGSSGKSTLFNTLLAEDVSPTGGSAGINRRVLIGAPQDHSGRDDFLPILFQPFGDPPQSLQNSQELAIEGSPRYILSARIPKNLVILDTPDFDTGAKGVYTNRELAQQALEAADIFIYIFTNANYNNRDNTDFIARMLTSVGKRKCFLVYRVYPSFSDEEVKEHAMTVAGNIYGQAANDCLLGIYRVDEDNEVAAGRRPMSLRPVSTDDPGFVEALEGIDPRQLRMTLFASILREALVEAEVIQNRLAHSTKSLELYLDALKTIQSHCVHEALSHFPMDKVMQRFGEIWLETDPGHIKLMRQTGRIMEMPVRAVMKTIRWLGRNEKQQASTAPQEKFHSQLEMDLLKAANHLYQNTVDAEIEVSLARQDPIALRMQAAIADLSAAATPSDANGGRFINTDAGDSDLIFFHVPAHGTVREEQERLKRSDKKVSLNSILAQREKIASLSTDMEGELRQLAMQFRAGMGFFERIQQTFSAFLNVLPATAAVTYILTTGDAVGAVGIKVKLTGLFGLHDLYALVAIPATAGLKKADMKQLADILGPVAQSWLNHKLGTVKTIFEETITGGMIHAATDTLTEARKGLDEIKTSIKTIQEAMQKDESGTATQRN